MHVAAHWGGTAFNWLRGPAADITPGRPARFWFSPYAASASRFPDVAGRASADVLLSNHTNFDACLTAARQCAEAGLATTPAAAAR